jgi:CheY-like chemotaxis protein
MSPNVRKVLIIEDSEDIQFLLKSLFSNEGYEVSCASNGRQALDYLNNIENLPGVILLDLTMPVMDGYEFRAQQMANPRLASIPVILMTAAGETKDRAAKVKANAALKKPFEGIESIIETVATFFD